MIDTILAEATTDYTSAAMAIFGLIAVITASVFGVVSAVKGKGNGNGKLAGRVTDLEGHQKFMDDTVQGQTALIAKIDSTTDATMNAVSEMHGAVKMLPCVRGEKASCMERS